MKFVLVVLFLSFLSGCADTYQVLPTAEDVQKLNQNETVYISVPTDGRYGQTIYTGSGLNTAQILLMAFSQYSTRVEIGQEHQNLEASLEYAQKIGAGYLVFPTILEWEDRSTEWSGIPDKASIKISVFELTSGNSIVSAIIKGKSGLATFGGDHPQDLLPEPVGEYIKSLYQ